jgi:hypothetical protein
LLWLGDSNQVPDRAGIVFRGIRRANHLSDGVVAGAAELRQNELVRAVEREPFDKQALGTRGFSSRRPRAVLPVPGKRISGAAESHLNVLALCVLSANNARLELLRAYAESPQNGGSLAPSLEKALSNSPPELIRVRLKGEFAVHEALAARTLNYRLS